MDIKNKIVSITHKINRRIGIYFQNIFHLNIRILKKGKGLHQGRYFYQKQYIDFQIKDGDKVLDIGSGGYPFPLATHLADFYEGETTHRKEELKRDDRPFTVCNLELTPFADKEFDFVYCSHVLEHVDDPAQACEELMRIGKRGYIETPSKISDTMFNFTKIPNHHKWHTQVLGNTLIFMEWKPSERRDLGTDYFFHQYHSKWKNPFQDLMWNNRDLFVNMMLWEDTFNYIVISKDGEIIDSTKATIVREE
ncbi:MAG: class I SAM-dependent methyltransferase [Pseudanabaena sp. Salubria-1]|nr:class I SAM-dependent methyltransferase [Pseudanabaena sp. Salubria-1]